ncbi:MAG: sulfatase-like hydrolase/transferase [Planctomycetota bacterium]|jgi:arylsulfatase A-like enzyme
MNRRDFLKTVGQGAAVMAIGGCGQNNRLSADNAVAGKPNFVFILIDDMGWRDVGFMGSTFYETPNIDRLANQGMVFSSAYSNAPNCAPTRASLLSGQYSPRHGIYTVGNSDRGDKKLQKIIPIPNKTTLDSNVTTFAELLKPAGYISASMGKWHLGTDPELGPVSQGFDINIAGDKRGNPGKGGYFSPYQNANLPDGPEGEYLTDRLTEEALKFLETNKDKPFFLYLPHYAVHTPIQAKKKLIEKYKKKTPTGLQKNPAFAAMVESVDQGVGKILAKLDDLKLTRNTVVIFTSDNGGVGGYREIGIMDKEITHNAPLKAGKGTLYEGGIRVPMTARWPGRIKPRSITLDFYPTILEIAGIKKPANHILDGESIVPLLTGKERLKRKAIFWHMPAYLPARGGFRTTPAGAIRSGDYKLIEFFEDNRIELYNLKDDIGEQNNLAEKIPAKARELHDLLRDWRKSVKAPVPKTPNPKYKPKTTIV